MKGPNAVTDPLQQMILIGLDDTDNATSRGTGHMARQLLAECVRRGMQAISVSRHQLLLDERIPYTSHNSSACIAMIGEVETAGFAYDFVAERSAPGSDPGVLVTPASAVPEDVVRFGKTATCEIVLMADALALAERSSLTLRPLGGTGLGVIGALSAVGLRADGNDGRIIELPGLRELADRVSAEQIRELGIELDHRGDRRPEPGDTYDTQGWVRPRMLGGRFVLPLEWLNESNAWIPVDRKRSRPLE